MWLVFFSGTEFMLADLFSLGEVWVRLHGSLLEGTPYSLLVSVATVPWANSLALGLHEQAGAAHCFDGLSLSLQVHGDWGSRLL